ncbi:hypothetical protein ABCY62_18810 [Acetivibrio clariflavus]
MDLIKALNQQIEADKELEVLISELMQREEYSVCTGNGCPVDTCRIND